MHTTRLIAESYGKTMDIRATRQWFIIYQSKHALRYWFPHGGTYLNTRNYRWCVNSGGTIDFRTETHVYVCVWGGGGWGGNTIKRRGNNYFLGRYIREAINLRITTQFRTACRLPAAASTNKNSSFHNSTITVLRTTRVAISAVLQNPRFVLDKRPSPGRSNSQNQISYRKRAFSEEYYAYSLVNCSILFTRKNTLKYLKNC